MLKREQLVATRRSVGMIVERAAGGASKAVTSRGLDCPDNCVVRDKGRARVTVTVPGMSSVMQDA